MTGIKVRQEKNRTSISLNLSKGQIPNESEIIEITRCGVRGLLKPKVEKSAFSSRISYVASPSVPLRDYFLRPVSKPDILFVVGQLVVMPKKLSAKKLPAYKVLFDPDRIFINETTKELQFLYFPVNGFRKDTDFRRLLLELLKNAKPQDVNADQTIDALIVGINAISENEFSLSAAEAMLRKMDSTIASMINTMNGGQSGYIISDRLDALNLADRHIKKSTPESQFTNDDTYETESDEEDTTILCDDTLEAFEEDDEDTCVLSENASEENTDDDGTEVLTEESSQTKKQKKFFSIIGKTNHNQKNESTDSEDTEEQEAVNPKELNQHFPTLYRYRTGEKIPINKPVFRLGKESTYVDYFVAGNEAVSRAHADIIMRGQRCFVRDLNSKNRTFVNDLPIKADTEVELFDEDFLRLANEDFRFNK